MPDEIPFTPANPPANPQKLQAPGAIPAKKKHLIMLGVVAGVSLLLAFGSTKQSPLPTPPKPPAHRTSIAELQTPAPIQAHSRPTFQRVQDDPQPFPTYGQRESAPSQTDELKQQRAQLEYKAAFEDSMVPHPAQRTAYNPPVSLPATIPQPTSDAATARAPAAPSVPETHILPEGTVLDCVLVNELNGDFSGPVEAQVSTDVYEPGTEMLLIPQGARVLGETSKVSAFGQQRLAVTFHRLEIGNGPDAYSVSLERAPGLDQQGKMALSGKVNGHYASIFGSSLAIGAIGGLAQIGNGGNLLSYSPSMQFRNGITQSTAESSDTVLSRFLSRMPTITIKRGTRIGVYLAQDLRLPVYRAEPTMRLEPTSDDIAQK